MLARLTTTTTYYPRALLTLVKKEYLGRVYLFCVESLQHKKSEEDDGGQRANKTRTTTAACAAAAVFCTQNDTYQVTQ